MLEAAPCCSGLDEARRKLPRHAREMWPVPTLLDAWAAWQNRALVFQVSQMIGPDRLIDRASVPHCAKLNRTDLAFHVELRTAGGGGDTATRVGCDPVALHDEFDRPFDPGEKVGEVDFRRCQFNIMVRCPLAPETASLLASTGRGVTARLVREGAPKKNGGNSTYHPYRTIEICPHRPYPLLAPDALEGAGQPEGSREEVVATPPRGVTLCTVVNPHYDLEADRIEHWAGYHRLFGIEHVFVYMIPREGKDYSQILKKLSHLTRMGLVTLVPWPFSPNGFEIELTHLNAYDNCMWRAKGQFQWVLNAQADEYFQPLGRHKSIPEVLGQDKYQDARTVTFLEYSWFNASLLRLDKNDCSHCKIMPKYVLDHGKYPSGIVMAHHGHGTLRSPDEQVSVLMNASGCLISDWGDNYIRTAARTEFVRHAFHSGLHCQDIGFGLTVPNGYSPTPQQYIADPFTELRQNHFTGYARGDYMLRAEKHNLPRQLERNDTSVVSLNKCIQILFGNEKENIQIDTSAGNVNELMASKEKLDLVRERTARAMACRDRFAFTPFFKGCGRMLSEQEMQALANKRIKT